MRFLSAFTIVQTRRVGCRQLSRGCRKLERGAAVIGLADDGLSMERSAPRKGDGIGGTTRQT